MIFQILLIILNIVCIAYVLTQRNKSPLITLIIVTACIVGIITSVFPDITNRIAAFVGIGRGADLLFYSWIVISFGLIINIQLKLITTNQQLTKVIRHIAIKNVTDSDAAS